MIAMRRVRRFRFLALLLCMGSAQAVTGYGLAAPALMPQPVFYQPQPGSLALTGGVRVVWQGARPALLDRAVARFSHRLAMLSARDAAPGQSAGLTLRIRCVNADPAMLSIHMKEHYHLQTDAEGATLVADGRRAYCVD